MDKKKRFGLVATGEIFLDDSEVFMKIEEVSSYNEDGMEEFEANAVSLSNGDLTCFGSNVTVTIPYSHNLIIEC
jgi:hypothetical protein